MAASALSALRAGFGVGLGGGGLGDVCVTQRDSH